MDSLKTFPVISDETFPLAHARFVAEVDISFEDENATAPYTWKALKR